MKSKIIEFEIIKKRKLPINISLEDTRKFPITEHYLTKEESFIIFYKFLPSKNLDEPKYILFLKDFFKKEFKASIVKEIKKNQ